MLKKTNIKFDFDVCHIIESPCRRCPMRARLPHCAENCHRLHLFQQQLVGAISCAKRVPDTAEYTISMPNSHVGVHP